MPEATSAQSSVGVRELKNQLSRYLLRVKAGEEITVTEHGRPIARLAPCRPDTDRLAELVAAGIVRPASAPRQLPRRRARLGPGVAIASLVSEQRR